MDLAIESSNRLYLCRLSQWCLLPTVFVVLLARLLRCCKSTSLLSLADAVSTLSLCSGLRVHIRDLLFQLITSLSSCSHYCSISQATTLNWSQVSAIQGQCTFSKVLYSDRKRDNLLMSFRSIFHTTLWWIKTFGRRVDRVWYCSPCDHAVRTLKLISSIYRGDEPKPKGGLWSRHRSVEQCAVVLVNPTTRVISFRAIEWGVRKNSKWN